MWRRSSEEWERQKSYLVRSLFENIPTLSPIIEVSEPRPNILSPARRLVSRAHSPLPELIVEKEKSRHDETKEYYELLEAKMIRLYRKLFYYSEYESESENDLTTETYIIPECDNNDNDSSSALEQNMSADFSKYDLAGDCISNSTNIRDVRTEGSMSENQKTVIEQYESSNISTEMSIILMPSTKKTFEILSEKDVEMIQVSERLVDTQAIEEPICSANVEETEIEAVRFQAIRTESLGSIPEEPIMHRESLAPIVIEKYMSPLHQYSISQDSYLSSDSSSDFAAVGQAISNSDSLVKRSRSSSLVPEDSPSKRIRYQSHEVQTSPVRSNNVWEDVRSSFFHGAPLIYNLCHCRDHECR